MQEINMWEGEFVRKLKIEIMIQILEKAKDFQKKCSVKAKKIRSVDVDKKCKSVEHSSCRALLERKQIGDNGLMPMVVASRFEGHQKDN